MGEPEAQLALDTIANLEHRLQRLEYALCGGGQGQRAEPPSSPEQTVVARMAQLERDLAHLASRNRVVHDLLKLQSLHPDLFDSPTTSTRPPLLLSDPSTQQIVLSSAPLYHSAASRLQSIADTPVAPAEASAGIVALGPRAHRLAVKQEAQGRKMAALRERSARVLERWYKVGVVGAGGCWAEWEGRVERVERGVARREREGREEREHPL